MNTIDLAAKILKRVMHSSENFGYRMFFSRDPLPIDAIKKDIPYGPHPSQRVDVLVPPGDPPYPVLLYLHGGGWLTGDKSNYLGLVHSFAHNGYLVFNANYRLGPENKYQVVLNDVATLMTWVWKHADAYGGDCSGVFFAGDSAGAHLLSWFVAALKNRPMLQKAKVVHPVPDIDPRGLLLYYGVYQIDLAGKTNFPFGDVFARSFLDNEQPGIAERARLLSPLYHVSPDFPPTFIAAGETDPLYPHSLRMAAALKDVGVPCNTLFFTRRNNPEAHHGFLNMDFYDASVVARAASLDFMRTVCAGEINEPDRVE
jgi:acetyl esterase/lipase